MSSTNPYPITSPKHKAVFRLTVENRFKDYLKMIRLMRSFSTAGQHEWKIRLFVVPTSIVVVFVTLDWLHTGGFFYGRPGTFAYVWKIIISWIGVIITYEFLFRIVLENGLLRLARRLSVFANKIVNVTIDEEAIDMSIETLSTRYDWNLVTKVGITPTDVVVFFGKVGRSYALDFERTKISVDDWPAFEALLTRKAPRIIKRSW